jgi:LPPG:FO 2-phospho-L-lactate transferase
MKIVALAGGVGGAKLAHGLACHLNPGDLTVIVNTADDFEHLGLFISPDLDTVCYTMAGLENPETGWGRVEDSFQMITNLEKLGGPAWFRLGDKDLATHLERTRLLKIGKSLSEITRIFCSAWGIESLILPMTDARVGTIVESDAGELPFQEYFVKLKCEPRVNGFRFEGAGSARPAPGIRQALEAADAVVICPSNPWVSIDPILNVIGEITPPTVAVSPIIGGRTVKGPAAKMFTELGMEPSAASVYSHYRGRLSGFVLDRIDEAQAASIDVKTLVADTLMTGFEGRYRLAGEVLHFIMRNMR